MFWCEPCKIYEIADAEQNELCGTDLYNILDNLNDEVEIIEEDKKIKKITTRAGLVGSIDNKLENLNINIMAVEDKINEIIDYLEEKNNE